MTSYFPHEASKAYELSLEWVVWADELLRQLPSTMHLRHELDRLSSSIAVGIAEAIGKSQPNDRLKTLEAAKSAVLTSAALIDVLGVKNVVEQGDIANAKRRLSQIYRLLSGMIQSANTNEFIRSRLAVPD